jgi:predicted MPP superfamily phosphohydrolase
LRIFIFLTIFIVVFALLNIYIIKRYVNKLHITNNQKKYFKLFLGINFIGIIGYVYTRYNPNVPNELFFLLSLPIGVLFILFCMAIVYDITHTIFNKVPMDQNRRSFFKRGFDVGTLGLSVGLVGTSIYEAMHIQLETVNVKLKNLKKTYKVAQISDVHIGGLIQDEFIKTIVDRINSLNVDIVVITGDLVDIDLKYAKKALQELTKLNSTYGTYFIVGNHEYIHGVEKIIDEVKTLGINVLENESVYIGSKSQGFNLAGVYDVMGYRVGHHKPNLKQALKMINQDSPTVLLAHQPRFIEEVNNDVDLVLSGHTHGGQIYPFRALVSIVQPYLEGLYNHSKDTQIYVNKGTGYWGPPMRLGTSCEITLLTLDKS